MPKVKLIRDPHEEQATVIRKTIRMAMVKMDIQTDLVVARHIGMSSSVFSTRMKTGEWRAHELCDLAKYLRFSAEDAATVLGLRS